MSPDSNQGVTANGRQTGWGWAPRDLPRNPSRTTTGSQDRRARPDPPPAFAGPAAPRLAATPPAVVGPAPPALTCGGTSLTAGRIAGAGGCLELLARSEPEPCVITSHSARRRRRVTTRPGRPRPAVARSVAGTHRRCLFFFFPRPHTGRSLSFFPAGCARSLARGRCVRRQRPRRPMDGCARAGAWDVFEWPPCRCACVLHHCRCTAARPRRRLRSGRAERFFERTTHC